MSDHRPTSCDLNPFTGDQSSADSNNYSDEKPNTSSGLEHVPEQKIKEMQEYARKLRKKFPHMKPDRLQRKVAEHFKIKLT